MLNRRKFIQQAAMAAGALASTKVAGAADWLPYSKRLTILHTNDVHSRIDPFPMDGSRNQGLGGVAARAHLINQIRKEEAAVLLLDAGDIFQGTPYFNIYKGEVEIKAMTAMGYDAATIGNHDFDAGLENLAAQVKQHAGFPMLVSNYNFAGTPMEHLYAPYEILNKGGLKIGLLGVGIQLKGLVPDSLVGNTQYLPPVQQANYYAGVLRKNNCDIIICLSHLGYQYNDDKVSDIVLAKETENIDVIIGGHTHTFLEAPVVIKNKLGKDVIVNQAGYAGIVLGRLDFTFEEKGRKKLMNAAPLVVSKKSD